MSALRLGCISVVPDVRCTNVYVFTTQPDAARKVSSDGGAFMWWAVGCSVHSSVALDEFTQVCLTAEYGSTFCSGDAPRQRMGDD